MGTESTKGTKKEEARERRGLGVVLAVYGVLALVYNLATPFGASPDEGPHAEYVRYLVERHRFPVFGKEPGLTYEAHQPPLYYVLAAPVWAAVGAVAPDGAGPSAGGEQQAAKDAAGRGAAQGRAVRVLTTVIGGVGLVLIWLLGRVLYRRDRWLPLAATAFAAFLPMRLAMAAAVTNDMLLEAWYTAGLLAMALMIRQGYTRNRAIALGAAMGCALLTKGTGVLLLPVALVAILLASRGSEPAQPPAGGRGRGRAQEPTPPGVDARAFFGGCLWAFGIAALLAGPWLLRNKMLYGDFLAQRIFEEFFESAPRRADFLAQGMTANQYWLKLVLPYTYRSFWGAFGHMTVWMPAKLYAALLVPTGLTVAGTVMYLMRARRVLDDTQRATWTVLWLCLFLVVSGFLRFNTVFFQAQARYLSPAMAPIALLVVIGWFVFVPPRARPAVTLGASAAMAVLAVYAVVGVIVPYFRTH